MMMLTLQDVTNIVADLEHSLTSCLTGRLPISLVPPTHLLSILQSIKQVIPNYLAMPKALDDTILYYYSLLQTIVIPVENSFHILTFLPLKHVGQIFNIFQILPAPQYINGTQAHVYYVLDKEYIAFAQDKTRYFYPEPNLVRKCLHETHNICQAESEIYYVRGSKDCLVALFLRQAEHVQTYCQRRVKICANPKHLITYIGNGHWLLSPAKPFRLTVSCQTTSDQAPTITDIQISSRQLVSLQSGCSAHSADLTLPTFYFHESSVNLTRSLVNMLPKSLQTPTIWADLAQLAVKRGNATDLIPQNIVPPKLYESKDLDLAYDHLKDAIVNSRRLLDANEAAQNNFQSTHVQWHEIVIYVAIAGIAIIVLYCCCAPPHLRPRLCQSFTTPGTTATHTILQPTVQPLLQPVNATAPFVPQHLYPALHNEERETEMLHRVREHPLERVQAKEEVEMKTLPRSKYSTKKYAD
ncbi:PREDICTED: uncharacterized protein LOC106807332 [Priapulus caudatus]|uniref:Uncharacterized protein LOC106807332 n=1 Tax=Priapulus caudatus TaxID=37621 RepID=A0ABM1DYV6_PRICU|nr:PREDICTED: uncharacterized protein LOC106807332 [Priapulus caudatus]